MHFSHGPIDEVPGQGEKKRCGAGGWITEKVQRSEVENVRGNKQRRGRGSNQQWERREKKSGVTDKGEGHVSCVSTAADGVR